MHTKNEETVFTSDFYVFIKQTNKPLIKSTGMGDGKNTELWIKYIKRGNLEKLVSSREAEKMENVIASIRSPQISLDSTKIYFISSAWVVSDAIHVVEIKTKKEKFICPGNFLRVATKGTYKGKLLIVQHRYKKAPKIGSYANYYIYDENGKQVANLGDQVNLENYFSNK